MSISDRTSVFQLSTFGPQNVNIIDPSVTVYELVAMFNVVKTDQKCKSLLDVAA